MKIGFLGPAGTFSEAALRQYDAEADAVPFVDVPAALAAVRRGDVDASIVPIENSVEGGVNATLDTLGEGNGLVIAGETLIPIAFTLAVREDFTGDIRRIGSHPHGWAQCRKSINTMFGDVEHVPTPSTAAAAERLAEGTDDFDASLSSHLSAEKYGLRVIRSGIADNRSAITRFVIVTRPGRVPEKTGADKTTLQVHLAHNNAGGLLEMLEQFSVRGVNLSRIESRPIGDALGRYAFSIDAEGHLAEERMQAVLIGLHRVCPEVRFLGSYPSFEGSPLVLQTGTEDEDFRDARAWVDSLVNRGDDIIGGAGEALIAAEAAAQFGGDSKERISVAARIEFARFGYTGASLRHIASVAGVDPSLIPYHFGGKEELFETVILGEISTVDHLISVLNNPSEIAALFVGESGGLEQLPTRHLALTAAIRTVLTPGESATSVQRDLENTVREIVGGAVGQSENPAATRALVNLIAGIVVLRNMCPVAPLSTIGLEELNELVAARLAVVGRVGEDPLDEDHPPFIATSDLTLPEDLSGRPAKDRIFVAARYLFSRMGYQGTSLREIASLAECDISLIHYYYGSKFGLIEAVVEIEFPAFPDSLSESPERLESTMADAVGILQSLLHDPEESAGFRALLRTVANPGDDKVEELVQKALQEMADAAVRASSRPDIDLGYFVLTAEVFGAAVLDEVLHDLDSESHRELRLLLCALLEGEAQGLSLVQLAARG